nr:cysteine protease 2 [Cryptocaryon irritans]
MLKNQFLCFLYFTLLSTLIFELYAQTEEASSISECNRHGFIYEKTCFCSIQYSGTQCQNKDDRQWINTHSLCDDLFQRLDHLMNISPDHYDGDDKEFSRHNPNTIGKQYNRDPDYKFPWIQMHKLSRDFKIFGKFVTANDARQGALRDGYLLAAFASLANIRNGQIIKDIFMTKGENKKHIYTTRWLINGKPRYVSVDDWTVGRESYSKIFSQNKEDEDFWSPILQKSWAKIYGSYSNTLYGTYEEVITALTQAPITSIEHQSTQIQILIEIIKDCIKKEYPLGASTNENKFGLNIFQNSFFAILQLYEIKLDDNQKQTLILIYNPRTYIKDYSHNPWNENSNKWTENVKSQVKEYEEKKNGYIFVSIEDFHKYFTKTIWGKVEQDYFLFYKEIRMAANTNTYITQFTYNGLAENIYVKIPNADSRVTLKNCLNQYYVKSMTIKDPLGKIYEGNFQEIINPLKGTYEISAKVTLGEWSNRHFVFNIYAPKNSIKFEEFLEIKSEIIEIPEKEIKIDKTDKPEEKVVIKKPEEQKIADKINIYKEQDKISVSTNSNHNQIETNIKCLNDCSHNGICDRQSGICYCFIMYDGQDCSLKIKLNTQCRNLDRQCYSWAADGWCLDENENIMIQKCPLSCYEKGIKQFDYCKHSSKLIIQTNLKIKKLIRYSKNQQQFDNSQKKLKTNYFLNFIMISISFFIILRQNN